MLTEKNFPMKAFSTLDVYIDMSDLDGLKCNLKSICAVDFPKQVPSSQEITEIICKLELNQALAEVIKLQCLILTIPVTYVSCERVSSLLKLINNYLRCSQSEEWLNNLVFISLNKDLLKKKVECSADTFYNKVINEFTKKK